MSTLLSAAGITKSYGRHSVLRGVTFDVKPREVLGVVGPNGAGKTTLLRLTAGLLAPDAGSLRLAGRPVHRALVQSPVAYFGGGSTLPAGVRAHTWRALFGASAPPAERRPIHLLSRGTRQMLGLAPIFDAGARRAALIVLDEPWEGLDPDAARWLIQSIRARRDEGAAILVSSHRLHELAEVCDRCAFLVDGRLELVDVRELSKGGALTGAALLAAFDALRQIP